MLTKKTVEVLSRKQVETKCFRNNKKIQHGEKRKRKHFAGV